MVTIKSKREIELMREAGRVTALTHKAIEDAIKPGMTTADIDKLLAIPRLSTICCFLCCLLFHFLFPTFPFSFLYFPFGFIFFFLIFFFLNKLEFSSQSSVGNKMSSGNTKSGHRPGAK